MRVHPVSVLIRCVWVSWLGATACGEAPDLGDGGGQASLARGRKDIDELQRIAHTPRTCDATADCPAGSHCHAETARCAWQCSADSDCGQGASCSDTGVCLAARPGVATSARSGTVAVAADTAACLAIPLAERLEALADLATNPAVCFDDAGCPCGAYCDNDATCRFDCLFDDPATPPFCEPGNVCSAEGRCIEATHDDDPTIIVDLELGPDVLNANTAVTSVVLPAELRIRARLASFVPQAANVTVRLEILDAGGPPGAAAPRVRCESAAAFASSCELGTGWQFGGSDPLRSAARTVSIELPQRTTPGAWTLIARSEWSDAPVSIAVLAQPVVEPPHETGHFTGTLTWPQAGGAPLVLPIEADVTEARVVVFEATRLLLPAGHAVLARDPAQTATDQWLRSDHASAAPMFTFAHYGVADWGFDPARERITANLRLVLGNSPAPQILPIELAYTRPTTLASCAVDATCGAGNYCSPDVGMCLPGSRHGGIGTGLVPPSAELASAQRLVWSQALAGISHAGPFAGQGIVGVERAYCHGAASQAAFAQLSSSNASLASRDVQCEARGVGSYAQQVFPYADRTSGVEGPPDSETFHLLDTCLAELAIEPASPLNVTNLLQSRRCVSVARFMLAATATLDVQFPDPSALRLQNQLLRQWLTLHALVARGATQENEYDEAVAGRVDEPAHQRLGAVVDVMEKGWRQVLRRTLEAQEGAERDAEQQPDYRALGRPVAHWTFNQTLDGLVQDAENDHDLRISNMAASGRELKHLSLTNAPVTCATDRDVALADRHFSLMAWLGVASTTSAYTLFEKASVTDYVRVKVYNQGTENRIVDVSSGSMGPLGAEVQTGRVTLTIPAVAGYYAFVADGDDYRVVAALPNGAGSMTVTEYTATNLAGPRWGAPGKVKIGCQVPQGIVITDEVSLWSRPLAKETVMAFGVTYIAGSNMMQPSVVSLPPRALTLGASDEQAQGLPVHLLDAAAAHMELVAAYVRSEEAGLYAECGGASGPVRDRVRGRVGRALRFVALAQSDAAARRALAGTAAAPWLARYDATTQLLAGRRHEVVQQLAQLSRCDNPLGINDEDLPLYQGEAVGASARFFASARFLVGEARAQVDDAITELALARNAWTNQRASAFQTGVLDPAERGERIRKIEGEFEGVLRRQCGVPSSGTLLAGFRDHTLTASNCFLKLGAPGCAGVGSMAVKSVPAACLRGELGEQIVALQAADLDARNADNTYERALGLYDAEMEYCTRREEFHAETQRIQDAHRVHMSTLRSARHQSGIVSGFIRVVAGAALAAVTANPALATSTALDAYGLVEGEMEAAGDELATREVAAHQLVIEARAQALDNLACFHGADNQKFAIDAARDVIARAHHDTKAAMLRIENQRAEITALVDQANGEVEVERQMVRVLPHHHNWLDDHIDAYRRHLRYAKRLTYLALRAFEHESQQTLAGAELAVLSARTPTVLDEVVHTIEQRTAPMQGEQGYVAGEFAPVMSLRDEILRLGTADAPPGFPRLTPEASLRAYLASDAARIYSNGQYVGRGVRFMLRPPSWAQFSCAERIWRITTALQVEGAPVNNARLLLWQENAFGSQRCRANERGTLHVARVRPGHNLLVGDGGNFDGSSFVRPSRFTAMEVTGLGNRSREDLGALPEGAHAGFAGRGLYASYVLLFPSAQFDNPTFLATVKDVLIRFDIVSVTDISGDPNP